MDEDDRDRDDDRYGGLEYDELLDVDGRPFEPIDIDDVLAANHASGLAPAPARVPETMDVTEVMAQLIVADLDEATAFYTAMFGRPPDASPMAKLHEWHVDGAGGVQVYEEPERAGRSGATIAVGDLEAAVASLDAAGIEHEPIAEADYVRIVVLADPDGNRVVLAGEK